MLGTMITVATSTASSAISSNLATFSSSSASASKATDLDNPTFIYGLIAGAIISLISVYINNRYTDQRQNAKFEHEHSIKLIEVKKETFMELIDATETMNDHLFHISSLEFQNLEKNLHQYEESCTNFLSAASKASIVANEKTLIQLQLLQFAHKQILKETIEFSKENIRLRNVIDPLQQHLEEAKQKVIEKDFEWKQSALAGHMDDSGYRQALEELSRQTKRLEIPYEQITKSFVAMLTRQKQNAPHLYKLKSKLIESLRTELSIKNDSELQESLLRLEIQKEEEIIDQMINEMNARLLQVKEDMRSQRTPV